MLLKVLIHEEIAQPEPGACSPQQGWNLVQTHLQPIVCSWKIPVPSSAVSSERSVHPADTDSNLGQSHKQEITWCDFLCEQNRVGWQPAEPLRLEGWSLFAWALTWNQSSEVFLSWLYLNTHTQKKGKSKNLQCLLEKENKLYHSLILTLPLSAFRKPSDRGEMVLYKL